MPEDPIAQSEIAALTRRFEEAQEQNTREFGIIKSELTTLQLKVSNLDQKVDGLGLQVGDLGRELDAFITEQRTTNAQLVDLLTRLVGRDTVT